MHENVQHRIMREINENFSEEECRDLINVVDYEKLSALRYVEMAIKEALRLFSPATGNRLPFHPSANNTFIFLHDFYSLT